MTIKNTINYYNTHAKEFSQETLNVEFAHTQNKFWDKLDKKDMILDFGCGSGRDTKYFLEQGYMVEAIDGSKVLCRIASENTGISIRNMLFQELNEIEKYDGIWACSSILHLNYEELEDVMRRMAKALKETGIIYTSFKYGNYEGERNGIYFSDMTEEKFSDFIHRIKDLVIEEQWVTFDVRPKRSEEKWLNLILRKNI